MAKNRQDKNEKTDNIWWMSIETDHYSHVTRHGDPEDRWDGDDIAHDYRVRGYSLHKNDTYGDTFPVIVPRGQVEPDKNKTYWLVYARYGTGDSFHRVEGCFQAVDVFEDANDADYLAKVLEKDAEKDDYNYKPLMVEFPSGDVREIYTGTWKGYFEHLDGIYVERITYVRK